MYVYVGFFQLITVLCIFMYGLCPCACVAYDVITVMLFVMLFKQKKELNTLCTTESHVISCTSDIA